jgi:hypothetical protein
VGKLGTALRAFFRVFSDDGFAAQIGRLLEGAPAVEHVATAAQPPQKAAPGRSDALNLLSALQREGRLIDFLQEPLTGYSDAQIGAAVRDVHRDCAAALERMFALRPLVESGEGSPVDLPAGFDASKYRLKGNVGQPPLRGRLEHHGWLASKCELPAWTGTAAAASIVAPAEVVVV